MSWLQVNVEILRKLRIWKTSPYIRTTRWRQLFIPKNSCLHKSITAKDKWTDVYQKNLNLSEDWFVDQWSPAVPPPLRIPRLQRKKNLLPSTNNAVKFLPAVHTTHSLSFPECVNEEFSPEHTREEAQRRVWPPLNCAAGVPVFTTLEQPTTASAWRRAVRHSRRRAAPRPAAITRINAHPLFAWQFFSIKRQ